MDAELLVQFSAGFGVGALGLGVAVLVVVLLVKFLLALLVAEWRRQVVVLEPGVQAAADLLDGQLLSVAGIEVLADAAADKEAQAGDIIMSVDAVPAADLEMIEAEFFFGESEAGFNGPATEGDAEQAAECDAVLADDAVGQKVFNLSGADTAGNNQCVSQAGEIITCIAPDNEMFNLPDFGAFLRVFNQIALPGLSVKLRRVLEQAAGLAAGVLCGHVGGLFGTTRTTVCRVVHDLGLFRPDSHVTGDFGHKRLVPSFQRIEKRTISTI